MSLELISWHVPRTSSPGVTVILPRWLLKIGIRLLGKLSLPLVNQKMPLSYDT